MRDRLPILFIIFTVILDSMGIGLIMPVMPDLLREVRGGDLSNAAIWGGVLTTAYAAMQFLFSPLIGNVSDRWGRRPVLLISLLAMAGDYLLMATAGSIWLLLVGRIIGGICAATHSTAGAYMADVSDDKDKARNFGLLGAGFGIGFVLGPMLGGLLAEFGTRAPFYAAAGLSLLNGILGWFVLKETVTDAIRRAFTWRRANPLGAFKSVTHLPGLRGLLTVFFFYQIAGFVYPVTWAYFTIERLGWGPGMIGASLALFGVCFAIVQGVLVQPSIRLFGERGTVIVGFGLEVVMLISLAFAKWSWLVLALTPFAALAGIGVPALQAIMSQRIPDDAQGELQGVMASATSIALVLSPLVMTQAFAYFSGPSAPVYLPGAAFLVAALLMGVSIAVFVGQSVKDVAQPEA